ncbi:hypothetical protein [Collimonas humicola]|uniref:hypothetical protein n=1 Tax=Collimonas humicola TaxID=2825886 RepID=UPI001B8BD407|nr:hypothetical protein [Collimonas humicola]
MKGYFSFDWVAENSSFERRNFRFLFKSPGVLNEGDLADAIELSVNAVLFPDVIAIVCIQSELKEIREAFSSIVLNQAANRTSKKIGLCVCTYDGRGVIRLSKFIRNEIPQVKQIIAKHSNSITKAGLRELFSSPHISVTAPPGFTFVKPSGDRSTHFLRAEEALTEIEGVQFLSFSLLSRVSQRDTLLGNRVDVIYIDSMAIASVAYALREMYRNLFECENPRVVSFHSHNGLADLEMPLYGTSFCLISASSSMKLERIWKEKTHCHPAEVVTFLTLHGVTDAENALFTLPPPLSDKSKHKETAGVLKDLRMAGERFVPEEMQPKKILLKSKVHAVSSAAQFSEIFTGSNKVLVSSRGEIPTAKIRPIFVDGSALVNDKKFSIFLRKIIEQKTALSVQAIVHQDDCASLEIANKCANYIKEITASENRLPIISQENLELSNVQLDTSKALLIVAAVVGRGSKLLSISRDLRALHAGARTYVIGAQVAETRAQIIALNRNLEYSATKAQILIETFSSLAIGVGLGDSYVEEHDFVANFPTDALGDLITARKGILPGNRTGFNDNTFLPTGPNLTDNLKLRPDFAFWQFEYNDEESHVPALFATIAAILQHARESKFDAVENRLASDAFQQVILDPENFSRYNDGAIQASLLRAAHRGELDYSSERVASQYILDFLIKIFSQHDHPQGEAALEFALAIRVGRLKLMKEHEEVLRKNVEEVLQGDTPSKRALRLFLDLDSSVVEGSLPSDF